MDNRKLEPIRLGSEVVLYGHKTGINLYEVPHPDIDRDAELRPTICTNIEAYESIPDDVVWKLEYAVQTNESREKTKP